MNHILKWLIYRCLNTLNKNQGSSCADHANLTLRSYFSDKYELCSCYLLGCDIILEYINMNIQENE